MLICSWEIRATVLTDPEQTTPSVVEVHQRCVFHLDTWSPMLGHIPTRVKQLPHDNKVYSRFVGEADHIFRHFSLHKKMVEWRQSCTLNLPASINIHIQKVATQNTARLHILYSQALRIKRICSERENLLLRGNELKFHLSRRGYLEQVLDSEINQAINTSNNTSLLHSNQWNQNRVPLVVTYHSTLPMLK